MLLAPRRDPHHERLRFDQEPFGEIVQVQLHWLARLLIKWRLNVESPQNLGDGSELSPLSKMNAYADTTTSPVAVVVYSQSESVHEDRGVRW